MGIEVKPTVDFAFKKIFGSPENSISLIGLLNAILDLVDPIVATEILNPFSLQELSPAAEFQQAVGVIEAIAAKTEDRVNEILFLAFFVSGSPFPDLLSHARFRLTLYCDCWPRRRLVARSRTRIIGA